MNSDFVAIKMIFLLKLRINRLISGNYYLIGWCFYFVIKRGNLQFCLIMPLIQVINAKNILVRLPKVG